jgi:hypothetical protein
MLINAQRNDSSIDGAPVVSVMLAQAASASASEASAAMTAPPTPVISSFEKCAFDSASA